MLFLEEKTPSFRLAFAAGMFVAGEGVGFALREFCDVWIWVGCMAVFAALLAYGWGVSHILFPFIFCAGVVLAMRTESNLRNVLDDNAGMNGRRPPVQVVVEGSVRKVKNSKTGGWRVDFESQAGPLPLRVVVPVSRRGRIPQVGETWKVDGWIAQKPKHGNRYARRMMWVPEARHAKYAGDDKCNMMVAGWQSLAEELSRRAAEGLSWCPDLVGLNRAILLGQRNNLPRAQKRAFVDAGTIHVFAISGLHVMVMAWILRSVLCKVGINSLWCSLISLPLVWAYVVLTGARPSAVRAAAMTSLMLAAPVFARRPDSLSAWSLTVIGVYGLSPERLFDLGCALSFTVMFGIVFWCHWSKHFRPWFAEGSFLRRRAGEFGVSFAAWVAGVPLAAYAFGRFTPGGLLANMVVIYFAKWMVQIGAGALMVSFVCLPLAAILNNAAVCFTWAMAYVSEKVAWLPFSSFEITPWSLTHCIAWYAAWFAVITVAGIFLPRRENVSKKWW